MASEIIMDFDSIDTMPNLVTNALEPLLVYTKAKLMENKLILGNVLVCDNMKTYIYMCY